MSTKVQAQVQAVQDFADQLYDMNVALQTQVKQQEQQMLNLEYWVKQRRSEQQQWNGVAEAMLREFARKENKKIQKLSQKFEIWEKRVADLSKKMDIFYSNLSKRVSDLECPSEEYEEEEEEEEKNESINFPKFEEE